MDLHLTSNLQPAASDSSFAERWRSVHRAGQEIGAMAALGEEELAGDLARFPQDIEAMGGAKWALAQDTLSDLDAILKPGLCALRSIAARGQDTTAPALALWREFHASRSALLALTAPMHAIEPSTPAEPVSA